MPKNIPERNRKVFVLGAGFSSAFDLPNTAALLTDLLKLAEDREHPVNKPSPTIPEALQEAFEAFYPDAHHRGFLPDVVDFFSTLATYIDLSEGMAGAQLDSPSSLQRRLKRGIARLLIERVRAAVQHPSFDDHAELNEIVAPGNIVITTNWDPLVEAFAAVKAHRLRLSEGNSFRGREVVLLKLHGSVDWCQMRHRKPYPDADYASLTELVRADRPHRPPLPDSDEAIVRVRTQNGISDLWRRASSRSNEPYMVTMATGKQDDLGPLDATWKSAYRALSRADEVRIIGYSLPSDDLEVRTLLRAGLRRGGEPPHLVTIENPSPDVAMRARAFLQTEIELKYVPFPGLR